MKFLEREKGLFERPKGLGSGTCLITEELQIEADRRRFPGLVSEYTPRKVKHPELPASIIELGASSQT